MTAKQPQPIDNVYRYMASPRTRFRYVSDLEAEEVGEEEAVLREAIRTPSNQMTPEQKELRKAWAVERDRKQAVWERERGITVRPITLP